ncbi:hypothetical protein ACFY1P_19910 [Streptomyces sp. NPDC001407]|uniref:hypothetical protein n=1 Tax=Streptomyces sp. NPDC001407 TaxID=3364573 RepID=UPI003679E820
MTENDPTGRTRALLKLGNWPIRRDNLPADRAALVAAAWRTGNRNIAELAHVADVTRDVIYADLRSHGIEPTDPEAKKEPPVSPAALTSQSARSLLLRKMKTLFDDDRGLGVLVEYNGRPDMTDHEKTMQRAWTDALISLHGLSRAAGVYSAYAKDRQLEVARSGLSVGSWDNLVLGTKPIGAWVRDEHDFMCAVCGGAFPSVLVHDFDPACLRCARDVSEPGRAAPLWKAYTHDQFVFPGWLRKELDRGESTIRITFDDNEERAYTAGDAALLFPKTTRLPNFTQRSAQFGCESRETITAIVEARTENEGRTFDILATFTYDPRPEGREPHPYGFRFTAARMTPAHLTEARTTEYTDVYELLDDLLTGLWGGNPAKSREAS